MKILLVGPQACGKGTQGEKLSEKLGIPLVGVGDLLRDIPKTHPRYTEVQKVMTLGELVSEDLVAGLIKERVSMQDCFAGYILDGWARRVEDMTFFDPHPDVVLVITIPREESLRRISGRRVCDLDNKIYNIYTMPPEELKRCEGHLTQREDDTEEAVNRRLDIYKNETIPVVEHYRKLGKVVEIDGMGLPDEVFGRISSQLGLDI